MNLVAPTTNKNEIILSAEVTISFLLENVCYLSDLNEDDINNHFAEIVEERILSGDYEINFDNEVPAIIASVRMIS